MSNTFNIISNINPQLNPESVVGMGVYSGDRADWVEQSINSIVEQTYQRFGFVIVIDGQIDDGLKTYLLDVAHNNSHILLVQSEINCGLSKCMNFVIDWALKTLPEVKFFFRMDSDDISLPERFEKQVAFFYDNPDVSILGTSLVEINEKGLKVGQRKLPAEHHEIARILPKRCAINHPTVAIRFDVFRRGFRYLPYLRNTQDYFLWAELCASGCKFANLPQALLQFRRVNDFYKRRGLEKSINEFKARFYTMRLLRRYSLGNIIYAFAVLFLRLMPSKVVKLAYKIDRYLLNK